MPTLDAIQHEIQTALSALDDVDLSPEDYANTEAAILAYLDDLANQESAKVDGIARVDSAIQKDIDWLKDEEAKIAAKRRALTNRKEQFRKWILGVMASHSLQSVKGRVHSVSRRKTPVSVIVEGNPQSLPSQYRTETITYSANKAAIKDALLSGAEIPGCHLVQGEAIAIR